MTLNERIQAFTALGQQLRSYTPGQITDLAARAGNANPWFDERNVSHALNGISSLLDKTNLEDWAFSYDLNPDTSKKVGVVMAGNIPLVGFHDLLCVLLSGHDLVAKLSSDDTFLMQTLATQLIELEPQFGKKIQFVEFLKDVDAVIATGSDNTARYFEYYFGKKPNIIRKNRSSLGVLTGRETTQELQALGKDIFQYYGLGCRNVSKVLVPAGYDFQTFFESIEPLVGQVDHHKYQNNYDYNKSLLLINQTLHLDNGFLLVTESTQMVSPISVLFYQTYTDNEDLSAQLEAHKEKTQCVVSAGGWHENTVPFGQAQCPAVWDYADGVDTLKFLSQL